MRPQFVMNSNGHAFLQAVEALEKRGAAEACLMIVDGEPGLGKSAFALWWTVKNNSIYIRALKAWNPRWMLRDIIFAAGAEPVYGLEKMFRQAVALLLQMIMEAEREQRILAIVIDEVDHISRKSALLEMLRDLSDTLEIPIILIGMGRVRSNLTRFPQVASRVGQYVEFKPITLLELTELVEQSLEMELDAPLLHFIHIATKGRMREIKEALSSVERFAKRNQRSKLSLSDMIGQTLIINRRTGKPVKVTPK